MASEDFKPGDEVRLLFTNRRRRYEQPEGGHPGTVTKTGRKYATAVFQVPWTIGGETSTVEYEVSFDMETGHARADTEGMRVRTPEQLERDERRKAAVFLLKEHGLEFSFGHERSLTLEQLEELAEVVKRWDQEA